MKRPADQIGNKRPADEAAGWLKRIAQNGDKAAFITLFEYFAPRLKSYLMRQGLQAALAEDLAQDVMFQIWQRAGQYDPNKARASTWIYTIARNRLIDERRKQKGISVPLNENAEDPVYEPQKEVERRSDDARILKAVAELPPEQRVLIEANFFKEQSHGDIATQKKIPLGTVKSRLRLALARLRDNLKGET